MHYRHSRQNELQQRVLYLNSVITSYSIHYTKLYDSDLVDFRHRTFDSFNPKAAGVAEAFRVCREYAEDPRGWLVLVGPVGCGKTHLAARITSYNVCYTKLLRVQIADHRMR